MNYKHIPISIFDIEKLGNKKIRNNQNHNSQSSRNSYSPFSINVAELCVEYFLRNSTKIFDPFAGWGERHLITTKYNKEYFGYDTSPYAINYAKKYYNVTNQLGNSLTDTIPEHNGVFTCPPYWNLEKYQSNSGLDKIKTWEGFLGQYKEIWKRIIKKSLPNTTYCIIVGNWRKNKFFYDLNFETQKILNEFGLKKFDEVILSSRLNTKIKIMLPQAKRFGYTVKVHQYLLIYKK